MQYLFSESGRAAMRSVMAQQPLLAFDFDGTLAPVAEHPDHVLMSPPLIQRLEGLSQTLPTAVITGRAVADVRQHLRFTPRYVVGSHGAEEHGVPGSRLDAASVEAFEALRRVLDRHAPALRQSEVFVEDKIHSLALHYRQVMDEAAALQAIHQVLAELPEALRSYGGKHVVNVVALSAPHKGDALCTLVERCGAQAAVFVGDDLNDEAAFAIAPPHWLTVRVGADMVDSKARFFVEDQAEVLRLLDALQGLVSAPQAGG